VTKNVTKNENVTKKKMTHCSLRRDSFAIWASVLDEFEDD